MSERFHPHLTDADLEQAIGRYFDRAVVSTDASRIARHAVGVRPGAGSSVLRVAVVVGALILIAVAALQAAPYVGSLIESLRRTPDVTVPLLPSPSTAEEERSVEWTGPVREESGEMTVYRLEAGRSSDSLGDATTGWVDIVQVSLQPEGQPHWRIRLAEDPPDTADPSEIIAYGLVFETSGDNIADIVVGIDGDTPNAGELHAWVTYLESGNTIEQIGPPYGYPVEFGHPAESLGDGLLPEMWFTFLAGSRPSSIDAEARFYAFASRTVDGEVVAWDYAPDDGWLADRGATEPAPWVEPTASMLPDRGLPRCCRNVPAGEYGWTGYPGQTEGISGDIGGMHSVVEEGDGAFRQTQLVFAVADNCFEYGSGAPPQEVTIAGLDGYYVEPYADPDVLFSGRGDRGDETTGAYALDVEDRTLCVYLTWDPETTPRELDAARDVVDSIRSQPIGPDGIRINFTLPAGWDTG